MRRATMLGTSAAAIAVAPFAMASGSQAVDQSWKTHQTSSSGGTTVDKGTVSGGPFGKGTIVSRSKAAGSGVALSFTEKFSKGTVKGKISVGYKLIGAGKVKYSGSGKFTSGTGKFAGITGKITSFTGSNSGKNATLKIKGTAKY